jgi:hypothetical protein
MAGAYIMGLWLVKNLKKKEKSKIDEEKVKIVFCVGEINGEQLCTLSQMYYTLVYHCIIIIRFCCHLDSYAKS